MLQAQVWWHVLDFVDDAGKLKTLNREFNRFISQVQQISSDTWSIGLVECRELWQNFLQANGKSLKYLQKHLLDLSRATNLVVHCIRTSYLMDYGYIPQHLLADLSQRLQKTPRFHGIQLLVLDQQLFIANRFLLLSRLHFKEYVRIVPCQTTRWNDFHAALHHLQQKLIPSAPILEYETSVSNTALAGWLLDYPVVYWDGKTLGEKKLSLLSGYCGPELLVFQCSCPVEMRVYSYARSLITLRQRAGRIGLSQPSVKWKRLWQTDNLVV